MNGPVSRLNVVGVAAVFGAGVEHGIEPARLVRRGLPAGAVQFILDPGRLTLAELDQIVLPRRMLASRRRLVR
jgi:hypothetical protein